MRRVKICEERGSGIDKTIAAVEAFELPAKEKLIKPYDPDNKSPKHARYVPFWG